MPLMHDMKFRKEPDARKEKRKKEKKKQIAMVTKKQD